jgi:aspartyl-tRNA(Asn)/glutamyl-tRNA(Gln) amidotransferase subunit C
VTTPPQPLTAKDVAKVGLLARLALSESDLERMTGELSKIVGFVSMLGELDTADVAPLAHPLDTQNVFRDDVPAASLSTAEALQSAPRHDGACFLVPAVLGDSGFRLLRGGRVALASDAQQVRAKRERDKQTE